MRAFTSALAVAAGGLMTAWAQSLPNPSRDDDDDDDNDNDYDYERPPDSAETEVADPRDLTDDD